MREKLSDKQARFALEVAELIRKANELGYKVTFGETWRSPEEAKRKGFANSNHTRRLAVDLNLFKDGKYLAETENHRELGEWWEARGADHAWGGRFRDGNHYSFEHEGVK